MDYLQEQCDLLKVCKSVSVPWCQRLLLLQGVKIDRTLSGCSLTLLLTLDTWCIDEDYIYLPCSHNTGMHHMHAAPSSDTALECLGARSCDNITAGVTLQVRDMQNDQQLTAAAQAAIVESLWAGCAAVSIQEPP